MLTQTSETAIQVLVYLARRELPGPATPKELADMTGTSPSYMAKICSTLTKADLLRAQRGMRGGVTLSRDAEAIALLDVVEACQGKVLADYCVDHEPVNEVCAFHCAMLELHHAIVGTLRSWTIAQLAVKPGPSGALVGVAPCRMRPVLACLTRNRPAV